MKGKACYIRAAYITWIRDSCKLRPEQSHEMDMHHGLHTVIGVHDGELEVAPMSGTCIPLIVPEYAVFYQDECAAPRADGI